MHEATRAHCFSSKLFQTWCLGTCHCVLVPKGESTVGAACASATNAIGEAFWRIQSGKADVMLTGRSEATVNEIGIAGFAALTALSVESDRPKRQTFRSESSRLRPGRISILVTGFEYAQSTYISELVGYGASSDAYHMTSPSPDGEGAARAMRDTS